MANIRDIFAKNLRESRRKSGFTQVELAEKADVSTHYIAMIELAKNFPKGDIIERLAKSLDIEIHELFTVPNSYPLDIKQYHKTITKEIKKIVEETVENAFEKRNIKYKKSLS